MIGLIIGAVTLGSRFLGLFYGERLIGAVQSAASADDPRVQRGLQNLRQAADKSPLHVVTITGMLVLVLAAGVLGLIALGQGTARTTSIVLSAVALVCGLGLFAFRSWAVAAVFTIAGALALAASVRRRVQSSTP